MSHNHNSYVEVLTPCATVFQLSLTVFQLRGREADPVILVSLKEKPPERAPHPDSSTEERPCDVRTQWDGGHWQARKRALSRNWLCWTRSGASSLQNYEKISICCLSHPTFCYGSLRWLTQEWNIGMLYTNMDDSQKYYAKWNKPDTKGHILYDYLYEITRIGQSIEIERI